MNTKNNVSGDKLRVNSIHTLCSYLAMFPPKLPRKYIEEFTNEGDVVFDPFSGRGTTLLEAKLLNRKAIGNDLSPLGFVLSKAKVDNVLYENILQKINELEIEFNNWIKINSIHLNMKIFKDVKFFYSKHNLNQLTFLREKLGKNFSNLKKEENFVLFLALGLMHGQMRKNGTTMYFSLSMPNGYSMSSNYVKNYAKKHNLKRPETNVFEQLRYRLKTRIKNNFFNIKGKGKVFNNNALISSELVRREKVDLILTSPPYLNIVHYVDQNWIRYWLLGIDKANFKSIKLDDKHSLNSFKEFLFNFFIQMQKIMKLNTKMFLIIGDVKEIKIVDVIKEILSKTKIKIIKIEKEIIRQNSKLSNQMGLDKVGKATKIDYIIQMEKENKES